ncbi:exodeoxyribonuclease VII large subunit [Alsobacter soli]|uniref:Exodeoxyribonuclease 7 large subunit n=1 Tax=Alsobacter soli TaxID=2109933 RepID=A0A2T1HSM0_9HYPH|nr:exodeoxyribonuclease VII large subunit [Alsobacter soli]PSC04644.1 exodeoxyribonuclease VII large subunit [Alsobacter soli]
MFDEPVSNVPEWSVSELSGALRRTLEDAYGHVRVRAELGKVTVHGSGHVYLDLKDDRACLAGVIWRGAASKMRFRPEMGMEVIATGKITTFPGQSKYQLIIETLEPAGVGALLAQIEERKKRLAAEGLFDEARKQLLPYLPAVIGVVTSPTGAVIRDILHRLSDRFPRHVLVWPVRVQGDTCAAEVTAAIRGFNALPEGGPIPRPDLLIVARGGGSIEDLWGFNDEQVVRAAADSGIPLISAVGHETDWTLIDYAADRRAPTPTGAAEMAVPVRSELMASVGDLGRRVLGALMRHLDRRRADLRSAARALPGPEDLLATPRQRLDLAGGKLAHALVVNSRKHEARLAEASRRLARLSPQARLAGMRAKLDGLEKRLAAAQAANLRAERQRIAQRRERLAALGERRDRAMLVLIGKRRERLERIDDRPQRAVAAGVQRRAEMLGRFNQLLESYNYRRVLERGYALVHGPDGHLVREAAHVALGTTVEIEFADGKVKAVTGEGPRPRPARPKAPEPVGQGTLFGG